MPDGSPYALELTAEASDDSRKIDKHYAERIVKKLRWLAESAAQIKHEGLTGQWAGYYRYRIGDYRALYQLDYEGHILIVAVCLDTAARCMTSKLCLNERIFTPLWSSAPARL